MSDLLDIDRIVPELPEGSRMDMVEWANMLDVKLRTLDGRINSAFQYRDKRYNQLQELISTIEKEIDDLKKRP